MAELENTVNLTKLYDYADELAKMYKIEIQNADAKASGQLQAFTHNITWNGETLKLTFDLPLQWYYIENGRRPTQKSEGGVLLPIIREWIKKKGIVPRDGDFEGLAYAITKSIHKYGFFKPDHHGKHLLQHTIEQATNSGLINKIINSVKNDLEEPIKVSLADLTNR